MPIPLIPAKVYPIILLLKMIIEDNSSVPRNKRCAPLTISIYPKQVEVTLKIIPNIAHDRKGMTGKKDFVRSNCTIKGAVGRKMAITGHNINNDTTVCYFIKAVAYSVWVWTAARRG